MGYADSPAAKMLATQCAVCARPLVDAVSVERGIGPDCAKKYGFDTDVDEPARVEANALVYKIALEQSGIAVLEAAARLREIGFDVLGARILERKAKVRIEEFCNDGVTMYSVRFPFDDYVVSAIKSIHGARFLAVEKEWVIPRRADSREKLWKALCVAFRGCPAVGPKGPFVLGQKAPTAYAAQDGESR